MSTRGRISRLSILALIGILTLSGAANAAAPPDPAVRVEIDYLLDRVQNSGYVFIRNGSEHTSAEAAKHMRRKYEYFADKGEIVTVEDFIDLAGTKSLLTGRQYTVRLPDDTVVPTAEWLRGELEARHQSAAGVSR
jgi:hypothetical protein